MAASLQNATLIVSSVSSQYISTTSFNVSTLNLTSVSITNLTLNMIQFNGQSPSSLNYGISSGIDNVSSYRIAVGPYAGTYVQDNYAIGIGYFAGYTSQATSSIGLGPYTLNNGSSTGAIAIGFLAGLTRLGTNAIAGGFASQVQANSGENTIALGWVSQGTASEISSIAIGTQSGQRNQQPNSICIGYLAGNSTQAAHAVSLGHNAGISSAWASSITLNAASDALSSQASALYINPIRMDPTASVNMLHYDATTCEVIASQAFQVSSASISTINSNIISANLVLAAQIGIGMTSTLSTSIQLQLSGDNAVKTTTTTWFTSSDQRVKTNIVPVSLSICYSTIAGLPLKRFTWDSSVIHDVCDRTVCGFIAQDIENIMPSLVTKVEYNEIPDFRIMSFDQIQKLNIGATQQLMRKISIINNELKSLEDLIL